MNKTRYAFAVLFAAGISICFSSAHAGAAIVTRSAPSSYNVTTVYTTAPYVIRPAPCCYTSVVVRSAPSTATIKVIAPPLLPPARVVYVTPLATVYPAAKVVYTPATYDYVP